MNVYLLLDSRGWSERLDPDVLQTIVESRLHFPLEMRSREVGAYWVDSLPREECVVILILTATPAPAWGEKLHRWLNSSHLLYVLYTDLVSPNVVREIASLTVAQPVPRAPYRIVQHNGVGLDNAARWVVGVLEGALVEQFAAAPPVRISSTRWRNLPSNQHDPHAYPDQYTASVHGVNHYSVVAASHRGKTHAHHGTFREDAVAVGATRYWNLIAVADGAGSAALARIGSNLAVREALTAMRDAMPDPPTPEDVGRAIWAGLDAAYGVLENFAKSNGVPLSDLHTTLQLLIHVPQGERCLIGLVHVGDGLIVAETVDGQYYSLSDPDVDPEDGGRTLFLTSAKVGQWKRRTRLYEFEQPISLVAMMTDGLSGDLELMGDTFASQLLEPLRQRVLCYPLRERERALLEFIAYERKGSFDDRTLAILSRD